MRKVGYILSVLNFPAALLAVWLSFDQSSQMAETCDCAGGSSGVGVYALLSPILGDRGLAIVYCVAAIGGSLLPLVATLRIRCITPTRRWIDWGIFGLALACSLVLALVVSFGTGNLSALWLFMPVLMLLGCLYGTAVFFMHARYNWCDLVSPDSSHSQCMTKNPNKPAHTTAGSAPV